MVPFCISESWNIIVWLGVMVCTGFIDNYSPSLPFKDEVKFNNLLHLGKTEFLGIYYTFLYDVSWSQFELIGFTSISQKLLLDLAIIVEPGSKLRSIELLKDYFGIKHIRQTFYKSASKWLDLKNDVEQIEFITEMKQISDARIVI